MTTTPNRLKELRLAAGLSRPALGRELNVDPMSLFRWENGGRGIKDERKLQLAAYFGVSVCYLMGWPESCPDREAA